ncbi:metallophosphoesterase family protein [Pseudosulfitobacter pseudonitzschiae]|uniref:metallophosphoesterase family protein n=1 Tax=Pseudosulfitobacter pseudonitzschiae TaxID=1402135 RepID=UPI001AFC0E34|nr:DNA repair exonuclease [Pseudosulfitobacter pseudonitzschiae]MBM1817632.1 DNA repair exonuclease [Pseudosulfitobacter pseudonitzschiae]MBM1834543.1 DNA repair exonuclease [Pseudosulfitobacter pseudonitzschiae]MBM1839408.1 DNA repair exonuclease [Pseudosulfitobacter pseudonitzschiae]MBM1844258.1 DNA repair exonuclease [Pseudosulfitobacter pseudonitzschiae]MBM1849093.1 DNA repair exonuclease [Pseudosulfitobacter pseudonitzschiae]
MTIRILHTADCHLDSPLQSLALRDPGLRDRVQTATRTAFARIIDTALAEQVQALLIAGDLFDGAERSAKTAAFLTAQLDRLHAAGIAVFYIKGNHDAENPITGALSLPENVHVFDGRGGKVQLGDADVWIHGVSFAGRHAPDSLLGKFPAPVAGAVNIAMLHTSLVGAAGHDPYAPCTVAELAGMGFDYWALGHVHKRQVHGQAPWIVMPGTPQGRDMGESGAKSASLLTLDDAGITVSEVPTSVITFLHHDIDVSEHDHADRLRAHLREALAALAAAQPTDAILRLTLTGATPLRWQLLRDRDVWQETLGQMAQDTGMLWLEKLRIEVTDDHAPSDASATDALGQMMRDMLAEPGMMAALQEEFDALLAELPASRRTVLAPTPEAAAARAQRLAASGAAQMIARMKGADG